MTLDAWLNLLEQRHPQAIDMGLERCSEVYERMGSPRPADRGYTVAGTNGKGSTVAFLAAMLGSLGQSCGTFTSPHIFHFNEYCNFMFFVLKGKVVKRMDKKARKISEFMKY